MVAITLNTRRLYLRSKLKWLPLQNLFMTALRRLPIRRLDHVETIRTWTGRLGSALLLHVGSMYSVPVSVKVDVHEIGSAKSEVDEIDQSVDHTDLVLFGESFLVLINLFLHHTMALLEIVGRSLPVFVELELGVEVVEVRGEFVDRTGDLTREGRNSATVRAHEVFGPTVRVIRREIHCIP